MQILCIILGVVVVILVAIVLYLWGQVKDSETKNQGLKDYIIHINEALDLKEAECCRLHELANIDPLTGLLNRRTYTEVTERFKASLSGGEHNRKNGLKSVGFIIIDVDYFKLVNDNHGHGVGDEVLKEVAFAIKNSLRQSDLIFRMGGDEFSAIIPNVDNVGIRRLAEKVRKAVAELTFKTDIKITVSAGGAIAQNEDEFEELSSLADKALYKAKGKGRNFFQLA
jgi:diguanylate cyclase (GGDEF)-like protein